MAALEKTIKLTQAQYDTLAAGGTVGSYTGLNENYLYLVEDNDGYVLYSGAQSLTAAQKTQARSNIAAADADSLAKLYYNLGPYDTKNGNTITRQTGYLRLDPKKLVAHTNSKGLTYYTYLVGAGKQIAANCPYLGYSWANVWNVQSYAKTWEYNSSDGNISLLFSTSGISKGDVENMVVAYKLDVAMTTTLDSSYAPQFSSVYDKKLILDLVYPVGSIYISIDDAESPASIFGGSWGRIEGVFLLGQTTGQNTTTLANLGYTYSSNGYNYWLDSGGTVHGITPGKANYIKTSGEVKHTLTESEMPSHTHPAIVRDGSGTNHRSMRTNATYQDLWEPYTIVDQNGYTGGSQAHNNMPPYEVVQIWYRIS